MIESDATLRSLSALEDLRFPELALSAYLPTDQGSGHRYYRALLEDLTRPEVHKLDRRHLAALEREAPLAAAALEKRRFQSPAVAVFSCGPQEFMRIWRLPDSLPGRLSVADWLDLAPIRLQLFERPPALAAIVDQHQARLFALVLDELTELEQIEGLPISRHKQGGWSATALQRRQDEHARSNLRQVADVLVRLLERDGYRRLILAGPDRAREELVALLPSQAHGLIAAEGTIPMYASGNDLAQRLRRLNPAPASRGRAGEGVVGRR